MTKYIFWHLELVVEMKTTEFGMYSMHCLQSLSILSSVEDGHVYSKFVFISDQDIGLDKSLSEIFLMNHATNCVHHIKQNVKT